MITQIVLDTLRNAIADWLSAINNLTSGIPAEEAGSAIGGAAANAGRVLFLFIGPGVWGAVVTSWTIWFTVYIYTSFVAVLGRRGAGA